MPETEGVSRKKKVRAAHRASVTRMIAQAQEMLRGPVEELNVPKLKQKRQALQVKTELLNKLDEEIVEIVDEDGLDDEVEQADVVRERIELAIIDLDSALDEAAKSQGSRPAPERRTSRSDDHTTDTESPPDPTSHETEPPSGVHRTDSREGTPSDSRGSTPTPTSGHSPAERSMRSPHVKLPKLSLKKFGGDLTKWMTFWDTFESAVHNNPTLTSIDKFNYLNSLLESAASEAISGLTLTSANYEEAITTLKRRFGNKQLIVNRHMDLLLNLETVTSQHNLKGLRHLFDVVESNVRGLRALGVPSSSYGGLLSSILISKLPSELRLIISRELKEGDWDLDSMMKIIEREVEARERSAGGLPPPLRKAPARPLPTALSLVAGATTQVSCVYCEQGHQSVSCTVVTDVNARKEALRRSGRCYVCLRRYHISRDCRSSGSCSKCHGRHHVTICPRTNPRTGNGPTTTLHPAPEASSRAPENVPRPTNAMCVDAQTPVLLQTAKLHLYNLNDAAPPTCVEVRAIMDSGSQRTYVTSRVRETLRLPTKRTESLRIKTFGAAEGRDTNCDAVELGLVAKDGEELTLNALVVPFICNPLCSQPISHSRECYDHLLGLELADSAGVDDVLEVDVLIGSDLYWTLATGRVLRGRSGPMAIHTKVGWVLSGPTDRRETTANLTLTATHALRIDTFPVERLDDELRRFWELEALGIMKDESSVYEKFIQQVSFNGQRYQVKLPWKENHPPLPDNFELCRRRLISLLKRLKQNPQLLVEYDSVIKDQLDREIVEIVADPSLSNSDQTHYLPHHGVVRQDKTTSKLRIVYDASARTNGPSLNDCLYTGPSFGQSIFDILLRFRLHRVALAGDIEKAFLMVSVDEKDRDSLRFLWTRNVEEETPEVIVLRFARVAFGVSSSPFLLNATISHHVETYRDVDPSFVDKFLSSIYVDDVSLGSNDVESTYELYLKSKSRLAEAGFKLRKFVTNSDELRGRIHANEQLLDDRNTVAHVREEDQSYAKGSLGTKSDEMPGRHKILGVQWDFTEDNFVFDIEDVSHYMADSEPTKRNVVSMTARFFDPLGVVSPVTVMFKMFFQQLCEARVGWDDALTGNLLKEWNRLLAALRGPKSLVIPRCYLSINPDSPVSARLIGFCDASAKAYAAVVYLRLEGEAQVSVRFLAAKTRVSPLGGVTIPRLELLSALLLSKLMVSVRTALQSELPLEDPVCYTDSRVALYWIRGCDQEWKQFVENRVITIRASVPAQHWEHCPGKENPADIPSRGMTISEITRSPLWLNGPDWLWAFQDLPEGMDVETVPPDECCQEMKHKNVAHSLVVAQVDEPHIGQLMNCEDFSSLHRLLRVTALVLKFIRLLRLKVKRTSTSEPDHSSTLCDVDCARLYWIREAQAQLQQDSKFPLRKRQFDLFVDESQLWRCGGRMSNSDLPLSARTPILLDKNHHLTFLIVKECHGRVMHSGVKATLTELRSKYWLVSGRQIVKKILYKCVTCRRFQGKPYCPPPPPPLPSFRVKEAQPFSFTGVDFAGPLYVRDTVASTSRKVWMCLYTCCVTRAVHLDIVPDMTAQAFIRSFKRFTSRRGFPVRIVSDNAKTFKAAAKTIAATLDDSEVRHYFSTIHLKWSFNLERAPWWGGVFERMIQTAKRCLKRTVGNARLTYDELLTSVTEVEMILNSRPLSYVSSDDIQEPLTPSHLLIGYRVLSLPDPTTSNDTDSDDEVTREDLTRRMKHLSKTVDDFWKRWRAEYLPELREAHRHFRTPKGVASPIAVGDIVIVHDENQPRGLWKLGKVEELMPGADGNVRGAFIRVHSGGKRSGILKRPIQRLYPLEVRGVLGQEETTKPTMEQVRPVASDTETDTPQSNPSQGTVNDKSAHLENIRPRRKAFVRARTNMKTWIGDMNMDSS